MKKRITLLVDVSNDCDESQIEKDLKLKYELLSNAYRSQINQTVIDHAKVENIEDHH